MRGCCVAVGILLASRLCKPTQMLTDPTRGSLNNYSSINVHTRRLHWLQNAEILIGREHRCQRGRSRLTFE
jgi:hypothetical protein